MLRVNRAALSQATIDPIVAGMKDFAAILQKVVLGDCRNDNHIFTQPCSPADGVALSLCSACGKWVEHRAGLALGGSLRSPPSLSRVHPSFSGLRGSGGSDASRSRAPSEDGRHSAKRSRNADAPPPALGLSTHSDASPLAPTSGGRSPRPPMSGGSSGRVSETISPPQPMSPQLPGAAPLLACPRQVFGAIGSLMGSRVTPAFAGLAVTPPIVSTSNGLTPSAPSANAITSRMPERDEGVPLSGVIAEARAATSTTFPRPGENTLTLGRPAPGFAFSSLPARRATASFGSSRMGADASQPQLHCSLCTEGIGCAEHDPSSHSLPTESSSNASASSSSGSSGVSVLEASTALLNASAANYQRTLDRSEEF
jgi:hypothetical protein